MGTESSTRAKLFTLLNFISFSLSLFFKCKAFLALALFISKNLHSMHQFSVLRKLQKKFY